jgi:hypothetical protein
MPPSLLPRIPQLWTVEQLPSERSRSVEQWENIAAAVYEYLLEEVGVTVDDGAFDQAVRALTGQSFIREVLNERLGLQSETSFDTSRVTPLRHQYGLDDLDPHRDHTRARVLILHAAEFRFVPYAEGAIQAIHWVRASSRADVRTAAHTVTQWSAEQEPVFARLAVKALTVNGESRAWRPFTKIFELALAPHRFGSSQEGGAENLSQNAVQILLRSYRDNLGHGHVLRELMYLAEDLGLLRPRPRFERDEEARRRSELTRILLDFELDRELPANEAVLLDLIESERGRPDA